MMLFCLFCLFFNGECEYVCNKLKLNLFFINGKYVQTITSKKSQPVHILHPKTCRYSLTENRTRHQTIKHNFI